ncbi:hypothetical protein VTK73DRAFT_7126 [Phialemonium thermophilum]|uniref:C2H2-type domain-containing protein n=1 Tax=Phialemonium thermophilum TaxID=223376 RepID=A0ABR3WG75_9PEZI
MVIDLRSRPYQCPVCPKAFGRADLLKRHVLAHDSPTAKSRRATSPATAASLSLGRVSQACRACAANHLRCTEEKPCHRCAMKGLECVWDRSADPDAATTTTPPPSAEPETADPDHADPCASTDTLVAYEQDSLSCPAEGDQLSEFAPSQLHQTSPQLFQPHHSSDFDGNELPVGQWMPIDTLELDADLGFGLNDIDVRFLEAYNTNLPFELDTRFQHDTQPRPDSSALGASADSCRPAAALGVEAYRNYYWKFRPNVQDHVAAEEHNLSLRSTAHDHASPESRIALPRRVTCARLSLSSRDKILTTVLQSCRSEELSRVVESFPTAELLDTLLQYFLTSPVARPDHFLHSATFDPNKKRPELLAAMVAAGAVLTSDPTLCKLGLAIQECLRNAIPRQASHPLMALWERNNALTRDLELWQAYYIILEIGLWSGYSRKVEIAESFLQPVITMVRRDGRFRRSGYPRPHVPGRDEDGAALHDAWIAWVGEESFKRLAFRLLEHDANASISLLVNPLVSYAEVQLPLPDPSELWAAPSAAHWRDLVLAAPPNSTAARPLTVADCLGDTESLHAFQSVIDAGAASFAFLSCVWRLTWEYSQLTALQRSGSGGRSWNAFLLGSRHEEIVRILQNFRISSELPVAYAGEIAMRVDLHRMHLDVPFDEIQLFAGVDGLEQARHVYSTILEWVASESARRAVWHGGQILRSAQLLSPGHIWGVKAIMLYHASLVLWVYGLLCEAPDAGHHRPAPPPPPAAASGIISPTSSSTAGAVPPGVVYIDGLEDIATQRFIQLGRGVPCIRASRDDVAQAEGGQDVPLTRPDRVMEVVVDVLHRNHGDMFRPHLVDNLIKLIGGLQKASSLWRGMEAQDPGI